MESELELGRGLRLRVDVGHVYLDWPAPAGPVPINLTFRAQASPAFCDALLRFLEENMPEGAARARKYLASVADTQARLASPTWGQQKTPPPGAGA